MRDFLWVLICCSCSSLLSPSPFDHAACKSMLLTGIQSDECASKKETKQRTALRGTNQELHCSTLLLSFTTALCCFYATDWAGYSITYGNKPTLHQRQPRQNQCLDFLSSIEMTGRDFSLGNGTLCRTLDPCSSQRKPFGSQDCQMLVSGAS